MSGDLVSIVIPCFRQGHLLRQSVESALAQTHPRVETIVVNDGSDDSTDEVARWYGDRIKYVKKENGGLPAARNSGIAASSGRYLLFLDADDLLHPEAIAEMVAAIAGRDDRLAIIGYKFFEQSPDEPGGREVSIRPDLQPFPRLLHGNFGPPHMLLCPRKGFDRAGWFRESLRANGEDWDMWLRLVWGGCELAVVPRILAYYRRYEGSMSRHRHNILNGRTEVLKTTHEEFLRRPELMDAYGRELLEAEHRVLRRWLATGFDNRWVTRIQAMIAELESRGFQLNRSPLRRACDRALGRWSDVIALKYFRWFQPARFQDYVEGCN